MRYGDFRGSWQVVDLPGSSQVAVSIHSFVFPEQRGTGHGKAMHEERLLKMTELGYNYALATVHVENKREVTILEKNGWKKFDTFVSSSTGHVVAIYGKSLQRSTK